MTQQGFTPSIDELPEETVESGEATSGVYLDQESLTEVLTILGDSTARAVGVIRAGIKVPIRAATKEMFALFEKMAASGANSDEIDKALLDIAPDKGKPNAKKSWTAPFNCQHFSVFERDFKNPKDAATLRQLHGDEKGRIMEFPIYFPRMDYPGIPRGSEAHFRSEMNKFLRHGWRGFGAGRLKFYSEFAPDGRLTCRYRDDVNKDEWKTRPCPGLDDPETCADFKRNACKFGGIIRCGVRGVSSTEEVVIHTNSWHAFSISIGNLRRVWEALGRIHGRVEGQPFLKITKQREVVGSGQNRKPQWIIAVQAAKSMFDLEGIGDQERAERTICLTASTRPTMSTPFAGTVLGQRVAPPPPPPKEKIPPEQPPVEKPTPERIAKTRAAMNYLFSVDEEALPPEDALEKYIHHNFGVTLDGIDTDGLKRVFDTFKSAATASTEDRDGVRNLILDLCRDVAPEQGGDIEEPF